MLMMMIDGRNLAYSDYVEYDHMVIFIVILMMIMMLDIIMLMKRMKMKI